jgi:hypothetical protein
MLTYRIRYVGNGAGLRHTGFGSRVWVPACAGTTCKRAGTTCKRRGDDVQAARGHVQMARASLRCGGAYWPFFTGLKFKSWKS